MKRKLLLTFTLTLLLSFTGFASSFNLKFEQPGNYTLIFDNNRFMVQGTEFNLQNIQPGNHYLRVISQTQNWHHHTQSFVVFEGNIFFPFQNRVESFLDHHGKLFTNNYPEYSHYPVHPAVTTTHCPPVIQSPVHGVNENAYFFNDLVNTVDQISFDSQRLTVMKQALRNNIVTSEQVLALMQKLSFESNRLEFAKYASHRVSDRHRYYIVNNGFTFSSSIRHLDMYLNRNFS